MHSRFTKFRLAIACALVAPVVVIGGGALTPAHADPTAVDLTVTPNMAGGAVNNVSAVADDSAAPGHEVGSFVSTAAAPSAKSDLQFSPIALFGRDVTLSEIQQLSYWTKTGATHAVDPRDWYVNIYTKPYAGDVSTPGWYGDRIGAEPYFSANIADPADTWNQWSLDGATNQLRWFESTQGAPGANFGAYTDPVWSTFTAGNALSGDPIGDNQVLYFSIQTGSAWANGFTGQLDGLFMQLSDGSTATVNFEPNPPACTTTCYVDAATGNDLNGGATADDAKQTVQAGVDAVDAGGTVVVAAGTYAESVTIPKSLTLDGAGQGVTVLQGAGSGTGIALAGGLTGVSVSDLTVQGYQLGIQMLTGPLTDISFTDVTSTANTSHGIWVQAFGVTGIDFTRVNASANVNAGSRGLWMINGVKTDVSITDGTYDNNGLVGIDISDGSVTGLTITGNHVAGNGDAGIGVLGAQGPGANLVAGNTVTNNGRYGIEVKIPSGSGAASGPGSIVVADNVVTRTIDATDARDYAGIAVFRRSVTLPINADQPSGVVVTGNTVSGFTRKPVGSTGDGFGIVVEGLGHTVDHNVVSGNDVGIQIQAGNTADVQGTDGFDRGNAADASAMINRNSITGNGVALRNAGAPLTDATCNWFGSAAGPGAIAGFTTEPFLVSDDLDGACTPTASIAAASFGVTEGGTAGFVISLSQAPTAPVTVSYASTDGTATTSSGAVGGADYFAGSGSVVFQPGDPLSQTVGIITRNDPTDEYTESFSVELTGVVGGEVGTASASTNIYDNDSVSRITIRDAATVEGNPYTGSLTKTITFQVRLNEVSGKPVTVNFTTQNGTGSSGAAAPTDFVAASGSVTFPAGTTTTTVTITIRKDRTRERDEQFFVRISSPVNASISDSSARGVITNDD